jgi:hypothetical protein
MTSEALLTARAAARRSQAQVDLQLRQLHERALHALSDPMTRDEVLATARARIAVWQQRNLCHVSYVNRWTALLQLSPNEMAEVVLGDDGDAVALRQNSPFGFLAAS